MNPVIAESMEYLERIANPGARLLYFGAIERRKNECEAQDGDMAALRRCLQGMEDAFQKQGDLSSWTPELLDEVDLCFVRNYVGEDGEPAMCIFFPDIVENLNLFTTY